LTSSPPIRKGVILAAGHGTRLLPATKAQPKEMFPLVDRPIIQYVVEEAVASGLDQIIMVTSAGKRAVEDYFDRAPALEHHLAEKGHDDWLEEIVRVTEMAKIAFVRQKEQKGIGHAVLTVQHLVGEEPFVLYFPDDIIVSDVPVTRQLIDVYERHQGCVLAIQQVPHEEIVNYGSIDPEPLEERVYRVRHIVEKPEPNVAPSDLGTVGRYVLTPDIFPALKETKPGIGGEIQLTDGLAILLQTHPIFACQFTGQRYDTGRPLGLLQASVEIALRRPDIGPELRRYLKTLDLTDN
jgi:UTP--glucose-1-phosphate uridylyltransferase